MKRIIIAMGIVSALTLTACGTTEGTAEDSHKPSIKESGRDMSIWTDEETGCKYVIYRYDGGNDGAGGITPRLGEDSEPICGIE